jgi:1-acyl-sn-glycerol-3-phosphate acyltransferase
MSDSNPPSPGVLAALSSALRFTVGFLIVAVASTVAIVVALPLLPSRPMRIKLCNYYGKVVGYLITRIAGVTPVVRNRERLDASFPAIYVSNHTSTLDAFLSIWLCPVGGCGVMKKQIKKIPFFGQLFILSGHLSVDRENKGNALAAFAEVARLVRKHRLGIWIMPEGTRSQDGRLLPFKMGFVHMAIATGLPVVPVLYHGAHRNWVKGTLFVQPTTVEIDVLELIPTHTWKVETAREHAREVHAIFARLLKDDQKPLEAPALPVAKVA